MRGPLVLLAFVIAVFVCFRFLYSVEETKAPRHGTKMPFVGGHAGDSTEPAVSASGMSEHGGTMLLHITNSFSIRICGSYLSDSISSTVANASAQSSALTSARIDSRDAPRRK